MRAQLTQIIAARGVPRLEAISQNWQTMNTQNARIAYSVALLAVDTLLDQYANYGIRNILHNPDMLARVTEGVDKTLGL
jgi:hypothetical protein